MLAWCHLLGSIVQMQPAVANKSSMVNGAAPVAAAAAESLAALTVWTPAAASPIRPPQTLGGSKISRIRTCLLGGFGLVLLACQQGGEEEEPGAETPDAADETTHALL